MPQHLNTARLVLRLTPPPLRRTMPQQHTITRDDLIDAVDDGLKAARHMPVQQKDKLREFARTATEFSFGSYTACPVTIVLHPEYITAQQHVFARRFDTNVRNLLEGLNGGPIAFGMYPLVQVTG